jgi:hypothetical protein
VLAREQLIREREQVMREREREARWQADFMAERMHVIHAQQRSAVLHQVRIMLLQLSTWILQHIQHVQLCMAYYASAQCIISVVYIGMLGHSKRAL